MGTTVTAFHGEILQTNLIWQVRFNALLYPS